MGKFFAFISRMKFINRWSLMRNTSYESLSVHSHEVSIIAHALCLIGNKRLGKNYNADKAAVFALAGLVSEKQFCRDFILPDPLDKKTAAAVAKAVAEAAVKSGVARI